MHQGTDIRWGGMAALSAGAAQTVPKRPFLPTMRRAKGDVSFSAVCRDPLPRPLQAGYSLQSTASQGRAGWWEAEGARLLGLDRCATLALPHGEAASLRW